MYERASIEEWKERLDGEHTRIKRAAASKLTTTTQQHREEDERGERGGGNAEPTAIPSPLYMFWTGGSFDIGGGHLQTPSCLNY